jgi:AcrR family transcriptional regulator
MPPRPPRVKKSYHHGNLRRDLVAAALEIINRRGPDGLTLRAVAARLGVTPTASYRHFASKSALLAAVASDGFTRMLEGMREAIAQAGPDPLARYEALAVGYVHFATAHPDHFRVMYGPQVDFDDVAVPERRVAFKMLTDAIEACQVARLASPGDARAIANQAWAYAHGLVTLHSHGILHRSIDVPKLIELARDIRAFLHRQEGPPPSRSSSAAVGEPSRPSLRSKAGAGRQRARSS